MEVLPESSLKLSFNETGITAMLDSGRVRFSTSSGTGASVTTKDATATADSSQPNVFLVDVECGNTQVSTQSGRVELRSGNAVKQIAAGSQDTAGTAQPGSRCTRLTRDTDFGDLDGGALALLLLGIGGAIAAAILATQDDEDFQFGDDVVVISPAR